MLVFGFVWRTFFCFSFFYLIFHQKSPLQKNFLLSTSVKPLLLPIHIQKYENHRKKMLLAYILSLDSTCDTVSLCVDSFFAMCYTMYHLFSLVLRKSIRFNIYIPKLIENRFQLCFTGYLLRNLSQEVKSD